MFNFLISATCFEPEGSSAATLLYVQLWYGALYVYRYQEFCRQNGVFGTVGKLKLKGPLCCFMLYNYVTMRGAKKYEISGLTLSKVIRLHLLNHCLV
jgi:hypothetical protein